MDPRHHRRIAQPEQAREGLAGLEKQSQGAPLSPRVVLTKQR